MTNPFEFHMERRDASREDFFFRKMFEKYKLSDEESKKYREIGLEFNADGSIASIRKNSEAEKRYEPIMLAGGDKEFVLDEKMSAKDYHIFVPKDEVLRVESEGEDFRQAA